MTTRWLSSGSGDRLNSPRLSVAKAGALAQGALPTEISCALTCGHGTQPRHPPSSGSRAQRTLRSPLMAKGRPMAALTRSLIIGLARFQSNNATTATRAAMATPITAKTPIATFLVRVMVIILGVATMAGRRRSCAPFSPL